MSKRVRSAAAAHPPYLGFLGHYDYSYSDRVYLAETMCNSEEWAEFAPVVVKKGNYIGVIFECHMDPSGHPVAGVDVHEGTFDFTWSYSTRLKQRVTSPYEFYRFVSDVAELSRMRMKERGRVINFGRLEHKAYEFNERKFILDYIVSNPAWAKFSLDYAVNEETRMVYGEIGSLRRTLGVLKLPRDNKMELWWEDQIVRGRLIYNMDDLNEFVEWAMDYAEDNTPIRFYTRRA